MNNTNDLLTKVASLPSRGFIELGLMLRKHDILSDLEKTAEVSTALVNRENEIITSFYKLAASPGFFGGLMTAGKALFDPKNAAKMYRGLNKGVTVNAARKATNTFGGRLSAAGQQIGQVAKKNPLAAGATAGAATALGGYGLMHQPQNPQQQVILKTGECLAEGGYQLLKAMNPWARAEDHAEDLQKLAAIGELNAKLNIALADSKLDSRLKADAVKLGHENHRECIATLKKLAFTKVADGAKGYAMGGNAATSIPSAGMPGGSSSNPVVKSMKSAFGGGGGKGFDISLPSFGNSLGKTISSGLKTLAGR